MEGNLIVKCCHCGNYFPTNETKKLKPDWEERTLYICNVCLEELPETKEEQVLYIHK